MHAPVMLVAGRQNIDLAVKLVLMSHIEAEIYAFQYMWQPFCFSNSGLNCVASQSGSCYTCCITWGRFYPGIN